MRSILIFISLSFGLCFTTYSQIGQVKKSIKNQEKGRLDKSEKSLQKAIEKNDTLAAVLFGRSLLLFDSAYAGYDLDSAYYFLIKARRALTTLDEKERIKHLKIGMDLESIQTLKERMEYVGFVRANLLNTEDSYIEFLSQFINTKHELQAMVSRDSLAFQKARSINTYQAYEKFMNKYPDARQVGEAERRYEKLYFDKNTADGKLSSYIKFLRLHPTTPYRDEAERNIFEISTAGNEPHQYANFIKSYTNSSSAKKASRLLYHLNSKKFTWMTDSLRTAYQLNEQGPLILILSDGKYGFMNMKGEMAIPANYNTIDNRYLCETLDTDFFLIQKRIVARNQQVLFEGNYDEAEDLGLGIIKVITPRGVVIIHKSGWQISELIFSDAKLLGDAFISYKIKDKWGIMTFAGKKLTNDRFDDIQKVGEFFIFKLKEQFDVLNKSSIEKLADNNPINFQALYSDYELLENGYLWLKTDFGETVFDLQLNEIVPYNQQRIIKLSNGFVVQKGDDYTFLDSNFKTVKTERAVEMKSNKSYISLLINELYQLVAQTSYDSIGSYDSLRLMGSDLAIGIRSDTSFIHFSNGFEKTMSAVEEFEFLTSTGARQYLAIKIEGKRDWIYFDDKGKEILTGLFDLVTPVGDEYLVTSLRKKQGLISTNGDELLPIDYDAVASYNNGYISYLGDKKFGIINFKKGINISNEFDRNITPYNDSLLIAEKNQKLALLTNEGEELSEFRFEEILYWNDTVSIVKENFQYQFFKHFTGDTDENGFKSIDILDGNEKLMIARGDIGYGVYSNVRGEIIPPTFNDIISLGSADNPVFFTEKHVEEAGFYVVIYYDVNGQIIHKQVYESDDYMLIYCED